MFSRKKYIQIESGDAHATPVAPNVVRVVDSSTVRKDEPAAVAPDPAVLDPTLVAYQLPALIQANQGSADEAPALLLAGFGSPLKEAVKAFKLAGAPSVFVTGTADKERGFSFSGSAHVVMLGDVFDKRLFTNEYALIEAACACQARFLLLCDEAAATDLLLRAAVEKDIRVLRPMPGDKSLTNWVRIERAEEAAGIDEAPIEWKKCPNCKLFHEASAVLDDGGTCPTCGELYRLTSEERIAYLFDAGTFEEWDTGLPETDPLAFPDFDSFIANMRKKSGREESVRCGKAKLAGIEVALCIMETTFMMGSVGTVAGEKITRTIERATALGLPLVIFTASGGMRMQEGLVSLMQMAKTSAAIERHGRAGLPYISVITDPTTGGVTASFAMEGDLVISEPHALIGFAGRRVIEDTIRQTLPEGFQTAEFALDHGLIDAIVCRSDLRSFLAHALAIHMASVEERRNQQSQLNDQPIDVSAPAAHTRMLEDLQNPGAIRRLTGATESDVVDMRIYNYRMVEEALRDPDGASLDQSSHTMQQPAKAAQGVSAQRGKGPGGLMAGVKSFFGDAVRAFGGKSGKRAFETEGSAIRRELSRRSVADAPGVMPVAAGASNEAGGRASAENAAWESVLLARNVHRPTAKYYIDSMVDGFIELHGDRAFGDDGAILAGIGWIQGYPVTIIAEEKGEDLNQRIARNFGCPQPEGYRKSLRLMKQAEKFGRPIVCLVDTQGAYCGMEAEERGQGNAIAENLVALSGLEVPVISVVLGEGGSGGALALAVGNRVAMQKHAVYSVLSPEGFASILWKDRSRAAEAAAVMKMSADEACEMGIVEEVLSEGDEPAHENPEAAVAGVKDFIVRSLRELVPLSAEELRNQRYGRFRKF